MHKTAILGAALAVLTAAPLAAEPVVLKLNSPAPPRSFVHAGAFEPWAQAVEQDFRRYAEDPDVLRRHAGHFGVTYDRVVDQVVDIGFILTAFAAGKIKQQDVAALPFEAEERDARLHGALADLREGRDQQASSAQVKLLGLWTFPNAAIHTKRADASRSSDFKGKKLVASNTIAAKVVDRARRDPGELPPGRGLPGDPAAASPRASLMPFTGMETFKLHEVPKHHLDAALGSDAAALIMNMQATNGLPAHAKAALDKHSVPDAVANVRQDDAGRVGEARSNVKDTVYDARPRPGAASGRACWSRSRGEWTRTMPDGAKVLEAFRAEVAAARGK